MSYLKQEDVGDDSHDIAHHENVQLTTVLIQHQTRDGGKHHDDQRHQRRDIPRKDGGHVVVLRIKIDSKKGGRGD